MKTSKLVQTTSEGPANDSRKLYRRFFSLGVHMCLLGPGAKAGYMGRRSVNAMCGT